MSRQHDLHKFIDQVSAEMADEYDRIYSKSVGDPGTAGDEGEENWATLFREWLPPTYHVATKGQLIGVDGTLSPQVDVVVLKPTYPKKLLEKRVWLAGGVAAAFECKNTLKTKHVTDAVNRALKFKTLYANRKGTPRSELLSPLVYGLLANSHSWKNAASEPEKNIERSYDKASMNTSHPAQLLDVLCVADLSNWHQMVMAYGEWSWQPNGAVLAAIHGGKGGPATAFTGQYVNAENEGRSPIGSLLTFLLQRLALRDQGIRDLAEYFVQAKLSGSSSGKMRWWPEGSLSSEVITGIRAGRLKNGARWDEWNLAVG